MPVEIELKFLVTNDDWRRGATCTRIVPGYLSCDPDRTVRVRLRGEQAFLTVKGRSAGITRAEIEFLIPIEAGRDLLPFCLASLIEKTRFEVTVGTHTWEIDEFHGDSAGLVVAEIELGAEDEAFQRPSWVGPEVSHARDTRIPSCRSTPFALGAAPDDRASQRYLGNSGAGDG